MDEHVSKWLGFNLWDKGGHEPIHTWKLFAILLSFAFLLRIFLLLYPEVIHNDGTEYIRYAKQISSGDWGGSKSPPLYPSLVAFAYLFAQDYEAAGISISVILGSLLVVPVFYLGKGIFNEKVGTVSALLAAVHPILYISSGSVLTEATYYFLFATSVLFSWYAFNKGRLPSIILFGLFTTLAYLTRPEAIGLVLIFSAWTMGMDPPGQKRRLLKRIGIISVAIVSFIAFSFPYLIQIRKDTERWGISKKTKVAIGSLSEEEEAPSLEYLRKRKGITFTSLIKHPLPVMGKIGTGLVLSFYKFQQVYNPLLFLLAIAGWIYLFKMKDSSLKGNVFLLAHLLFYFGLVFPFFFITRRYSSQMIPISLPWAAFGFLKLIEWGKERYSKKEMGKHFLTVLLVTLLIGLFVQGRVIHRREHRYIQREAGLWMKENLPKGSKVMSRMPQEAFYAEMVCLRMPKGAYEVIVKEGRQQGVRYLVVDEDIEEISPGFWEALKREDLVPVKEFKKQDQRITVFELAYTQ